VRTVLAGDDAVHPGDRMVTMLVPVTNAEGAERLDLRFAPQR
jgi:hypothetical protein